MALHCLIAIHAQNLSLPLRTLVKSFIRKHTTRKNVSHWPKNIGTLTDTNRLAPKHRPSPGILVDKRRNLIASGDIDAVKLQ
jgi:hypothetical protein